MTARRRMLDAMLFRRPDRVPLQPGGGRRSTLEAWHAQGLPADVLDYNEYAYRLAGGTLPWPVADSRFRVNERLIPIFDEKVIEERPDSRVVQELERQHLRNRQGVYGRASARRD